MKILFEGENILWKIVNEAKNQIRHGANGLILRNGGVEWLTMEKQRDTDFAFDEAASRFLWDFVKTGTRREEYS